MVMLIFNVITSKYLFIVVHPPLMVDVQQTCFKYQRSMFHYVGDPSILQHRKLLTLEKNHIDRGIL